MATAIDTRDEQRRRAWGDYVDALQDLDGAEYDHAEQEAWVRLQAALEALDDTPAPSTGPVG
jgi:hypothetical protein